MVELSLQQLEKWVSDLDNRASDPANRLHGTSFELTQNDSLGFSGDPSDFTVCMPWGEWANEGKRDTTAVLQAAVVDAIAKGTVATDKPYLDLTSLPFGENFMLEVPNGADGKPAKSVRDAIVEWANDPKYAQAAPVIRIVMGADWATSRPRALEDKLFTKMFWTSTANRITNANARVYVGYYNPDFHPPTDDAGPAQLAKNMVEKAKTLNPLFATMLAKTKPESIAKTLTEGVQCVSWNHGKVVAVNGRYLLTGGGNFWDEYAQKQVQAKNEDDPNGVDKRIDHDIMDTSAKAVGDAAVSAHKWVDYFWKYLNKPAQSDKTSTWWGARLVEKTPKWFSLNDTLEDTSSPQVVLAGGNLPAEILKCPHMPSVTGTGKKRVLTVSKMGDWHGPMREIQYPVLVIDLLRDILLNALWQWSPRWPDSAMGLAVYTVNKALSDDALTFALPLQKSTFDEFNINPVAWASRYTRTWAIAYAKSSVYICQQMLVQTLQAKKELYKTRVTDAVNTSLGLTTDEFMWDGCIWPFDLLIAIAQALGAIHTSSATGDWHGVYIVLTTKVPGPRQDWDDQTSLDRIRERVRRIMVALPRLDGGISSGSIDAALKRLQIKRVLQDDGNMYSHSKVVCVDEKLMYVGSDNAYPCWNEEHGIWVDDTAAIQSWISRYFKPYWAKCTTPTDEVAHFKALQAQYAQLDPQAKLKEGVLPRMNN